MNLDQFRVFVAVAERLHVTNAAKDLHITQSAASAAVAALETRYHVQLFDRVGRNIALTAAGRVFLEEARRLLRTAGEVEAALSDVTDMRRGALALQASLTTSNYKLPPVMHRYRELYPSIQLALKIANTADVARAVIEGAADLGLVEGEVSEPVLEKIPVGSDRLVLVVAPGHPWARKGAPEGGALLAGPWVLREPGSGTRQALERALAERGLAPDHLDVALELPSNEAVRSAVQAGAGATVLSQLVVDWAVRAGVLLSVPFEMPARPFWVLRRRDRRSTRAEDAFLDLLRETA